jgi:hypothetical protein
MGARDLFADGVAEVDRADATVYDHEWVVRKIRLDLNRGGVRSLLLFYYYAGRVIFVHEVRETPRNPHAEDENGELQYYFGKHDNGPMPAPIMIRWLDPRGAEVPVDSPAFAERARDLIAISEALYFKAIRKYP